MAKFKKSLQDLKTETGGDHEVRKLQRTIEDAIPRNLSLEDMARAASAKIDERRRANEENAHPPTEAHEPSVNESPTPVADTLLLAENTPGGATPAGSTPTSSTPAADNALPSYAASAAKHAANSKLATDANQAADASQAGSHPAHEGDPSPGGGIPRAH